jgi:hypothetical protein
LQKLNFALSHFIDDYHFEEHLVKLRCLFPLWNSVGQKLVTVRQLFDLAQPIHCFIFVKFTIIWKCYSSNGENELILHLKLEVMTSLEKTEGYYSSYFTIVGSFIQFIKLELSSCFLVHHSIYFLIELLTEFPRILRRRRQPMEELIHPTRFSFSFWLRNSNWY